jgi:glycosyltransferase involved in cell wall biosynthesis
MEYLIKKPSLLFLSREFRFPISTGTQLRIASLLKFYSKYFSITLIAVSFDSTNKSVTDEFLNKYISKIVYVPKEKVWPRKMSRLRWFIGPKTVLSYNPDVFYKAVKSEVESHGRFDCLHLDRWYLADAVKKDLTERKFALKYVIDIDASEYERRKQQAGIYKGSIFSRFNVSAESYRVRLWEFRFLSKFDLALFSSKTELDLMKKRLAGENLLLVQNGYDVPHVAKFESVSKGEILLYVGTLSYEPNSKGLDYLIGEVLPLVKEVVPSVELWHVGEVPDDIRNKYKKNVNVKFLGFVENIYQVYNDSSIVVVPVFQGAGTRIKVLEAAALGKAIVATSFGAIDIGLEDGVNIAIADDSEKFAKKCAVLLQENELRDEMGRLAKKLIKNKLSWEKVTDKLRDSLQ